MILLLFSVDGRLVGGERACPEPIEIVAKCFYPGRVELVDPAGPDLPINHQLRLLEHAEVLGDGGAAYAQAFAQLTDSPRSFSQTLKDRPTRRIR